MKRPESCYCTDCKYHIKRSTNAVCFLINDPTPTYSRSHILCKKHPNDIGYPTYKCLFYDSAALHSNDCCDFEYNFYNRIKNFLKRNKEKGDERHQPATLSSLTIE